MNLNTRTISRLVKQQFWLFGWDIRRADGNLLLEYGFQRTPNPKEGKSGSTRYHLMTASGDTITLWGFGVCWSSLDLGSVYLPRLKPRVTWTAEAGIVSEYWFTDVATCFAAPQMAREHAASDELTLRLLDWLIAYETAVLERCGYGYRRDAISAWRDPYGDPTTLLETWRELYDRLAVRMEPETVLVTI